LQRFRSLNGEDLIHIVTDLGSGEWPPAGI
jgi:hypothetical protein